MGIAVACLAVIVFGVFLASPNRQVTDSGWVVFTARSIVKHHDADLDEYWSLTKKPTTYQLEQMRGRTYYAVPLATSLAALPVVAVASVVDPRGIDAALARSQPGTYDALAAALLSTLTALMVFAIARHVTHRNGVAFVTGLVFAFGTQAWSVASRTVWMHTPSMLCLACAVYCALRARERDAWYVLLGASLGLAYFVRPTNAVAVVCFGLWAVGLGRAAVTRVALGGAAITLTMVLIDLRTYGRVLQPYFNGQRLEIGPTTIEALVGNLASPSRGLFIYLPVTLLCAYGVALKRRASNWTPLDSCVLATVIGYWLAVSCFPHWWGGWSYGPRLLTDIAPFLAWFLIPVIVRVADTTARRAVSLLTVVFVGLAATSMVIQARGALAPSTMRWNTTPTNVDSDPQRLWQWSDAQLLR